MCNRDPPPAGFFCPQTGAGSPASVPRAGKHPVKIMDNPYLYLISAAIGLCSGIVIAWLLLHGRIAAAAEQGRAEVTIDLARASERARASEAELARLMARAGVRPHDWLRLRGTPAEDLRLTGPDVPDEVILKAMAAYPILVERPIVETAKGVALCRPAEKVAMLL